MILLQRFGCQIPQHRKPRVHAMHERKWWNKKKFLTFLRMRRQKSPLLPQTSNRLRFRCTATGCSASTCLYKNGCVRRYSTFIRQRLDQWQWFPSLVSILRLPEILFASRLLLQRPASAILTTKQNNTDKKLDFSTGRVLVICDKSENTKLSILIKYVLRGTN